MPAYDMKPELARIERVIAAGPYRDDWASLAAYTVPAWYRDAKLGIFIHWGLYSVPAFGNEWYSRNMYRPDSPAYAHHIETYGPQSQFGYKDFIPLFTAERYDPQQWAALFRRAGARYVVPVAEHHDGYQMYKSRLSHWNSCETGPHIDHLGRLRAACEEQGLTFCASSHRAEHWFFMGAGRQIDSDVREPLHRGDFYWPAQPEADHFDKFSRPTPSEEFLDDWLIRCCEIIDSYRPKLLYFDWWIQHSAFKPYLRRLAAYYYNRAAQWGQGVVINYKHDAFLFGTAVPDVERGQFAAAKPFYWQTDTATAFNSWCYTENNRYKKPADLVRLLADIVSKNGNLLLNVGPRADGSLCDEDIAVLNGIGQWMQVNGEAIYGARVWRISGEGPTEVPEGQFSEGDGTAFTAQDVRFTVANGCLYAIVMRGSPDGAYCIRSLGQGDPNAAAAFSGIIDAVELLGSDRAPQWQQRPDGLHICTGRADSAGDYPPVFRIRLR